MHVHERTGGVPNRELYSRKLLSGYTVVTVPLAHFFLCFLFACCVIVPLKLNSSRVFLTLKRLERRGTRARKITYHFSQLRHFRIRCYSKLASKGNHFVLEIMVKKKLRILEINPRTSS